MSSAPIACVPEKEIIQESCCECGETFNVHWDAWSGMYHYLFEWEEHSVFCSGRCLEVFMQNLCYDCNQPRICCYHAQMEHAHEVEELEQHVNDKTR